MAVSSPHRPAAASPPPGRAPRRRQPVPTEMWVVIGSAVIAGVTLLWNITSAPDTMGDEVSYVMAARNVAQDGQLTWSNQPVFVHPPLSFMAQAGWLSIMGVAGGPVQESLIAARVFAAGTLVFAILLIGLLTAYLAPKAGRRRSLLLVAIVVVLIATDPVLLRYGRMALIEPFALFTSMLGLCLAVWLRTRRPVVYVPIVGLATGLALLTKEMSIFLLATPVVYAVLERNRREAVKAAGAVGAGVALWAFAFMLWPIKLGVWDHFSDVKLLLFKRLLGLVKTTGWNRPGFGFGTFLSEVWAKASEFGSTYMLLAGGGLALLWLLLHRGERPYRWLLAWMLSSYAFGVYMVAFGTLNEHLFVYLLPAAVTGIVLVGDAAIARRMELLRSRGHGARRVRRVAVAPVMLLVVLVGLSVASWARSYTSDGAGIFRLASYVGANRPSCEAMNAIATASPWGPLMPGRTVTEYGTAEAALSHGVHLFVINNKDARLGYALPELPASVKAQGVRLKNFPSRTYEGLELWEIRSDPYDPLADVSPIKDGTFVSTVGSRCGGFAVVDGPDGAFSAGWNELGGKSVLGPPMSGTWTQGGRTMQVFRGGVLATDGRSVVAVPAVAGIAAARPAEYLRAQLPPFTEVAGAARMPTARVLALVSDPAIRAVYFGGSGASPTREVIDRAHSRYGDPLGPPTRMADNVVRQPFANGVFEVPTVGAQARLAAIGQLAIDAGVVQPPAAATTPQPAPPLVRDEGDAEPTSVTPFVAALGLGLAIWTVLALLCLEVSRHRRARRKGPPVTGHPAGAGYPVGGVRR